MAVEEGAFRVVLLGVRTLRLWLFLWNRCSLMNTDSPSASRFSKTKS